jgi:hypothetical protein
MPSLFADFASFDRRKVCALVWEQGDVLWSPKGFQFNRPLHCQHTKYHQD